MHVAAQLGVEPGSGHAGTVRGHDVGGAAEEGERRDQHPPEAKRDQLGDACPRLLLEQRDRIRPDGRRLPLAV
jgi:hypothetical protein